MATVASVFKELQELQEAMDAHIENLNNQLGDLEKRLDELEAGSTSVDRRKTRGRNMTDEQRAEAGRRLQQARADKLGLDTIEQLRALHLRPGAKPTKAQIARVRKEFPVKKTTKK